MPEAMHRIRDQWPRTAARWAITTLDAPHDGYKALGDAEQWVTIAGQTRREWRALCGAIGQPSMADDPRFRTAELRKQNEAELDRILTAWTSERDRWEITEILQRAGVAAVSHLHQPGRRRKISHCARAASWSNCRTSGDRRLHPCGRALDDVANALQGTPRRSLPGRGYRFDTGHAAGLFKGTDRAASNRRRDQLTVAKPDWGR